MIDFVCGACEWTGYPSFDLTDAGKLCAQCVKCEWVNRSLGPADFNRSVAVVKDEKGVAHATETPARPAPRAPAHSYTEPPDVLALVRDRLAYLTAEEARLEGIRADTTARLAGMRVEAKKLRKMLAAAGRIDDVAIRSTAPAPPAVRAEHQEH